jgi:hypothetical protein
MLHLGGRQQIRELDGHAIAQPTPTARDPAANGA